MRLIILTIDRTHLAVSSCLPHCCSFIFSIKACNLKTASFREKELCHCTHYWYIGFPYHLQSLFYSYENIISEPNNWTNTLGHQPVEIYSYCQTFTICAQNIHVWKVCVGSQSFHNAIHHPSIGFTLGCNEILNSSCSVEFIPHRLTLTAALSIAGSAWT